tara:strand:- start:35 stop:610 length:576 start_codon:yes stop_codon:yes gene_type:complete
LARRTNSPWSKTYKEGLPTTAVDDHVNIDTAVAGTITTGVIDSATGQWKGITVNDDNFRIDATHEATPNTGSVLCPQSTPQYIDMTGFQDINLAFRVTNSGAYAISAIMGPADNYYANLTPVNAGSNLKGAIRRNDMDTVLLDSSETLTADVWNIFMIKSQLANQKLLQFNVVNNSGAESDIQFASMRLTL